MMREWPSVAVIVLNWNGWKDTLECLDSLGRLDYPGFKIYLIDNGSKDDSVARITEWTRAKKDEIRLELIQTGENLGFAAGNNKGIHRALEAGFDFVWLLNNDTAVEKTSLREMIKVAQTDDRIGVVGPLILIYRNPEIIDSAGFRVSRFGRRCRLLGLNENRNDPRFQKQRDVDGVGGASMLLRCKILRDVGLLDERYYLYSEEVDLCTRLRLAGFRCVYAPQSIIRHKRWSSIQGNPELADYYLCRSQILYIKKYSSGINAFIDYLVFLPRYFLSVLRRIGQTGSLSYWRAFRLGIKHGFAGSFDYRWPLKPTAGTPESPQKKEP